MFSKFRRISKCWVRAVLDAIRYYSLRRRATVVHNGTTLFTVRDLSRIAAWRANTFTNKEPETLSWIDSFKPGDSFLDIGANVGIYSLYAAVKGHKVTAIEPDALNFALLNLNILDNGLGKYVTAYPLSIHKNFIVSTLNITNYKWGGSNNSFHRPIDQIGNEYQPTYRQGSVGISGEQLMNELSEHPSHIKIDVDGNELFVIQGLVGLLRTQPPVSLLVELNESRNDYSEAVGTIQSNGYLLREKGPPHSESPSTYNHIFYRKN